MRTTSTLDEDGLQLITSNDVVFSIYVNVKDSIFGTPTSSYTGYAYDGLKRNAGIVDESDVASWSTESSSSVRGEEDSFPDRVFIVANGSSVVILNSDDLKVWMRFNYSNIVTKITFDSGFLCVLTSSILYIYSFVQDKFYKFTTSNTLEYLQISTRNSPSTNATGSQQIKGENRDLTIRKILDTWLVCIGHKLGITAFRIDNFNISSSTLNHNLFEKAITLNNTQSVSVGVLSDEIIQLPPYTPGNPLDFSSDGLRGDMIKFTAPVSTSYDIFVTKTLEDRFIYSGTVDPSIRGTHSSVELVLLKPCNICEILSDGSLMFSAGESFYRSVSSWLSGSVNVFTEDKSVSPVSLDLNSPFNGSFLRGSELYVASSEGVLVINKDSIENNQPYELRYSDSSDSTYSDIFTTNVRPSTSVAIDPQNGNVLMSNSDKIYEIQPSGGLHKLVRTITTGGVVNHILAFSNPDNELGV